jgi:hypothetical protein
MQTRSIQEELVRKKTYATEVTSCGCEHVSRDAFFRSQKAAHVLVFPSGFNVASLLDLVTASLHNMR